MPKKAPARLLRRPLKPPPLPPISPTKSPENDPEPPWPRKRLDSDSEDDDELLVTFGRPRSAPDDTARPRKVSYMTLDGKALTGDMMLPYNTPAPPPVTRDDRKYVLDPALFRERTLVGSMNLLQPFRQRGPPGLPSREPIRAPDAWDPGPPEDPRFRPQPPPFTLHDMMVHLSEVQHIPLIKVKRIMYSRETYKRLTSAVQEFLQNEGPATSGSTVSAPAPAKRQLNKVSLKLDKHYVIPRIPQRQLLLEMASLVKEQMRELLQTEVRTQIRALPKYTPPHPPGTGPHTEILLFEQDKEEEEEEERRAQREETRLTEYPTQDSMFQASTSRFFLGSRRSRSPFADANPDGVINPSELAILDSLVAGAAALSLKAHFISQLPDLTPLKDRLVYLNLSFNDLQMVPLEVCAITHLEVLKMRNNPIREVPEEIRNLKKLQTLVLSFCLISHLPQGLWDLEELFHLDLGFNNLEDISNDLAQLRSLRELSVEGNRLCGMPAAAIRMKLKRLRVRSNYMHPLFWPDQLTNSPGSLKDLACQTIKTEGVDTLHPTLPHYMEKDLARARPCDCCRKPMFGPGYKVIRPCNKIFGIRNLPFVFRAHSSQCAREFMDMYETLSNFLYGSDKDSSGDEMENLDAESDENLERESVEAIEEMSRANTPAAFDEPEVVQGEGDDVVEKDGVPVENPPVDTRPTSESVSAIEPDEVSHVID